MSHPRMTDLEHRERRERETRGVPARGVVIAAGVTALTYGVLSTGTAGGCAGGFSGDGAFVDASGSPSTTEPLCATFTFQPQLYVVVLIVGLLVAALIAMNRALTATEARRVRVQAITAVIAVGLIFTALHSVLARPAIGAQWGQTGTVQTVPFDNVRVELSEMER